MRLGFCKESCFIADENPYFKWKPTSQYLELCLTKNVEIMDVINVIIRNSSLNGMPNWYKATTLFLFSTIVVTLIAMLAILIVNGPDTYIQFGY